MDHRVSNYYKESVGEEAEPSTFHKVIPLHTEALSWEEVQASFPAMCRGWYELCHLSISDRIEFTRDFWLTKLPYHPKMAPFLEKFFSSLDDVGVFLTQKGFEDPFECQMVYNLKNDEGFFQASPPVEQETVMLLSRQLQGYILPQDYLAFLSIHNGFKKVNDTGVLPAEVIFKTYQDLKKKMEIKDKILTIQGRIVDPKDLIPFYQSFDSGDFQCFWADWYPKEEMGNVYVSETMGTISDIFEADTEDAMAYATFSEWLMFYLERVGV